MKNGIYPNLNILGISEAERTAVGLKLKETRRSLHITQDQMAKDTGLSEKTIRDFENGKKCPTYDTIVAMSTYLKVRPDLFFPGRLSAGCSCDDPELSEVFGEIAQLDAEKVKTVKSFLKTYLAGAIVT